MILVFFVQDEFFEIWIPVPTADPSGGFDFCGFFGSSFFTYDKLIKKDNTFFEKNIDICQTYKISN